MAIFCPYTRLDFTCSTSIFEIYCTAGWGMLICNCKEEIPKRGHYSRDFETEKLCIAGSCGAMDLYHAAAGSGCAHRRRLRHGSSGAMDLRQVQESSPMLSIAKTRVIHEYVFF